MLSGPSLEGKNGSYIQMVQSLADMDARQDSLIQAGRQ